MKKFLLFIVVIGSIFWGIQSFNNTTPTPVVVDQTTEYVQPELNTDNNFFSFQPPVQPSISGTRDENNLVLWKHLKDSANRFYIEDYNYVTVSLQNELECNRDMLIGINGKSMGVIHKNNSCSFVSDMIKMSGNHFRFPVDSIEVVGNGEKRVLNLHDYADEEGIVSLSFAVGQADNYVMLIEIE